MIAAGELTLLISLTHLLRPPAVEVIRPTRLGRAIGDIQLSDMNGNSVRLSDFSGMTGLINSWATRCPPCQAEMPDLVEFYQNHRRQDFIILAIIAGERSQSRRLCQPDRRKFPHPAKYKLPCRRWLGYPKLPNLYTDWIGWSENQDRHVSTRRTGRVNRSVSPGLIHQSRHVRPDTPQPGGRGRLSTRPYPVR